jgi:hypothetical protein
MPKTVVCQNYDFKLIFVMRMKKSKSCQPKQSSEDLQFGQIGVSSKNRPKRLFNLLKYPRVFSLFYFEKKIHF